MPDYSTMDEALAFLAPYGPDLRTGLTNHAPMAVEALCALDRADAVMPWLDGYRMVLAPRPAERERIGAESWRAVLGREDRTADWTAFMETELAERPWRDVAARWTARLAPGICASATHGVIRTAHAVRSLMEAESPARRRELAEGLGYWAAAYQILPTARAATPPACPAEAIARVPVVPEAQRRFSGTITSSLEALAEFPAFAPVIDMLDVTIAPGALLSELTRTFAEVYLANARDVLTTIVFVHGVTSLVAIRSLLPVLDEATTRDAIRYGWQSSCALYATFGSRPKPDGDVVPASEGRDALVDMAIAHGDEHAIKLTEACLREDALAPSPVYLAAARHAIDTLPRDGY
jgi:questin oxidase-like protein